MDLDPRIVYDYSTSRSELTGVLASEPPVQGGSEQGSPAREDPNWLDEAQALSERLAVDPAEQVLTPHTAGDRTPLAVHWLFTLNNYTEQDEAAFSANLNLFKGACYGREVGEQGTPHLQAFVSFAKQSRGSQLAKIWPRAHMAIAKASPWINWLYCSKGEQPKTEWTAYREKGPTYGRNAQFFHFGTRPVCPKKGSNRRDLHDVTAECYAMLEDGTIQSAMDHLKVHRPADHAKYNVQYRNAFTAETKPKTFQHIYVDTDFVRPLEIFHNNTHILLRGESGLGKTQYACAHFLNPLVVPGSDLERIQRLTPDHDGVVFDDCDLRHFTPTQVIGILGRDNTPRAFPCRWHNKAIPDGLRCIFTINDVYPFYNDTCSVGQRRAIDSRVRVVDLTERLFVVQQ